MPLDTRQGEASFRQALHSPERRNSNVLHRHILIQRETGRRLVLLRYDADELFLEERFPSEIRGSIPVVGIEEKVEATVCYGVVYRVVPGGKFEDDLAIFGQE